MSQPFILQSFLTKLPLSPWSLAPFSSALWHYSFVSTCDGRALGEAKVFTSSCNGLVELGAKAVITLVLGYIELCVTC